MKRDMDKHTCADTVEVKSENRGQGYLISGLAGAGTVKENKNNACIIRLQPH